MDEASRRRASRISCSPTRSYDWRLQNKLGGEPRFSAQGRADIGADGDREGSFNVPENTRAAAAAPVRFLHGDHGHQSADGRRALGISRAQLGLLPRHPPHARRGARGRRAAAANRRRARRTARPLPEPVEAEVKLTRIDWQTNRVEEADEAENFRSEPIMQLIGQAAADDREARAEGQQVAAGRPGQKRHVASRRRSRASISSPPWRAMRRGAT